jgi:chromosome segregation ATPase
MNNYTTKQLLMCEKEDLVKHIAELKGTIDEHWKDIDDMDDTREQEILQERQGAWDLRDLAVKEADEWKMKCVEVGVENHQLKEQAQITCDCKDVEIEALKKRCEELEDLLEDEDDDKLIDILDCQHCDRVEAVKALKERCEELQTDLDFQSNGCTELAGQIEVLKDEVQVWEREQEELTEQNEKLKKGKDELSRKLRIIKSYQEDEKVEVKGTITITSDTEPFEEMVVEFSETITKEQYEDEDWMENIDDHLKLTEPYSVAGCDIQIDFK